MKRQAGFTLIELLVVISIISVLISILLPALSATRRVAWRTSCLANMRQMGVAIQMYGDDNDGFYPALDPLNGFAQSEVWRWAGTLLFDVGISETSRPLNTYLGITQTVNASSGKLPSAKSVTRCPADLATIFGAPVGTAYEKHGTSYLFNGWGRSPFILDGLKTKRFDDLTKPSRVVASYEYGIFYTFNPGDPSVDIYKGPHEPTLSPAGNFLFADGHAAASDYEPLDALIHYWEGETWTFIAQ